MKSKTTKIFNIFIILFIPLLFTLVIFKNKDEKNYNTYSYKYTENEIEFYKNDELINIYKCTDECTIHRINTVRYFKDGKTILKDGDYVFTYDILKGEILGTKVKTKNQNYEYVHAFTDYLLVVENKTLKLINYKEETIKEIGYVNEIKNITLHIENNYLIIKTLKNTYNVNLEKIG